MRVPAHPSVGVEHEYRLWHRGRVLDFRRMIGAITQGMRTLDPGDPRARRLPSGVALTADGWEAELATPPLPAGARAVVRVDDMLRSERTELWSAACAAGADRLTGYSTHLNISVPDSQVVSVGEAFARHCLAALAEVMEPLISSGVFVRPRRGRLEVGGEYVEGPDLGAALTLMVGCVEALRQGVDPPPVGPASLEPSREKFGWFARQPPTGQLRATWSWSRPFAVDLGLDPATLDALAEGVRPLRRMREREAARCTLAAAPAPSHAALPAHQRTLSSGVHAETEWLTWQHAVWLFVDRRGRMCRAVVPVEEEAGFLEGVDNGHVDLTVARMLQVPWPRRRLLVHAQLRGTTWWHEVRPGALVPAERLPDGSSPRVTRLRAARALRHDRNPRQSA